MNRLEKIINLKLNNFEIVPPKEDVEQEVFADYPWSKCIDDQMERYGDEEIAKKVCGSIRAGLKKSFAEGDSLEGSCWEGYEPIGLKPSADGSRMVPNCVKIEQSKQEFVIPSPKGNEDENTFISRCNSELYDEFPDDSQRNAICYKSWRGE